MNAIRLPYVNLYIEKATGRSLLTRQGNSIWDNLSASRNSHRDLVNVVWWDQPTLKCYTPQYFFHGVHSVIPDPYPQTDADGGQVLYPVPDLSASAYPACTWERVSGTALVRSTVPDGPTPLAMLKIIPPADGSGWAFQTTHLPGGWGGGLNIKGPGDLPENGSVAVTLRIGQGDQPPVSTALIDGPENAPANASAPDRPPLFVRVLIGNLWAVTFPQDGSAPFFEKKFRYKDKAGNTFDWVKLHTFTDAKPLVGPGGTTEWLVSFVALAGRLVVNLSGRDLGETGFVYSETKPGKPGALKTLKIPAAPVRVQGSTNDGAPLYVGLRRIGWGGGGRFSSTLTLNAAVGTSVGLTNEVTFTSFGYIPGLIDGLNNETVLQPTFTVTLTNAYTLSYLCQIPATVDDREPCALKWLLAKSPRVATPESGEYVNYGPALTGFTEDIAEPSFAGDGTAGSRSAAATLTFSRTVLDDIAAKHNTDWRADLAAYSPATWVVGNYVESPPGTLTRQETTRIQGYLMRPRNTSEEFQYGTVTCELVDPSVRLMDPAGFIDTRYHPLSLLTYNGDFGPQDTSRNDIYGYEGVRYILGQAIDPSLAQTLKVFMPASWLPIVDADAYIGGTGKLPAEDMPLWNPPYGQYAEGWLKDLCIFDYACLYFAGLVPIYGQFDQIIANTPTWDIYDGADSNGLPLIGDLPDAQQPWVVTKGEIYFDTGHDFNRFLVWGDPPGGVVAGTDGKALGAPLLSAQATDFRRVSESWERTDLVSNGGRFYTQETASQYAVTALQAAGGAKAAMHYKVTLPFAKHEVFWGHKLRFHTPKSLPEMNGKTLRVLKMTMTGQFDGETGVKASTEFDLIELI